MKDIDELIELLGERNRYSAFLIFFLSCMFFPISFNHVIMSIYGVAPPHRCTVPEGISLNESIPLTDDGGYDSCHVYVNYSKDTGLTEPCPNGWYYEVLEGETTIVTEWDLVCNKLYLAPLSTSIYFISSMIGGLFIGTLSDAFGRKKIMLAVIYIHIVLGVMVYFVKSFVLFVILRAIIGFIIVGGFNCIVLSMEWARSGQARVTIGSLFQVFWGISVIMLGLITYGVRGWRNLQLAITLPWLLYIAYIWLIPESMRWLLTNGHYKEAERCLIRGAKFNSVHLSHDTIALESRLDASSHVDNNNQSSSTLLDFFKYSKLRTRIIITNFAWLSTGFMYYGLALNASSVPGNKHINFIVSGLVDIPCCMVTPFLHRFGRKSLLMFFGLTSGICCILSGAVPLTTSSGVDISALSSTCAWLGKLFNMGAWSIVTVLPNELFPTSMRNKATLLSDAWARVGSTLAPQLTLLAAASFRWVPSLLVGGSAVVMAGLVILLPETRDIPLPDTIEDVQKSSKPRKEAEIIENTSMM